MIHRDIVYFERAGGQNTDDTIRLALQRAIELNIKYVVVASTTGRTGVKVASAFGGGKVNIIVVGHQVGFSKPGERELDDQHVKELAELGATIVEGTHALSGVERSISRKLGGASRVEAMAEVLRSVLGQGAKVCVEISVMAADAGKVPVDGKAEILALGGTWDGADTACVIRPAHANNFFDLHVMEIVCMPREKSRPQ